MLKFADNRVAECWEIAFTLEDKTRTKLVSEKKACPVSGTGQIQNFRLNSQVR